MKPARPNHSSFPKANRSSVGWRLLSSWFRRRPPAIRSDRVASMPCSSSGFSRLRALFALGAFTVGLGALPFITLATALNPGLYRFFFIGTGRGSPHANSVTSTSCPGTLTLNDTGDTGDATPGDGFCDNGSGLCTLRAAIEEANADSACGTITIDATQVSGTINLTSALP